MTQSAITSLSRYSQQLALLLPASRGGDFPARLIGLLKVMVPIDDATIVFYPATHLPVIEYFEVPDPAGESSLGQFVKGAFLLDPYYQAGAQRRQFGFFCLRDLAPTGFRDSEYFRTWYRNCGYTDECGYLVDTGDDGFINIALGRTGGRARFGKAQVETLRAIQPTIEALCRQHWAAAGNEEGGTDFRGQLHSALVSFGSSLLTEREAQVINLVLHGNSTRGVAERLSISVETVKLHRKHAYAKLEISSQAELFYLFIDSLMSSDSYSGGDTLVAYHQPARRVESS